MLCTRSTCDVPFAETAGAELSRCFGWLASSIRVDRLAERGAPQIVALARDRRRCEADMTQTGCAGRCKPRPCKCMLCASAVLLRKMIRVQSPPRRLSWVAVLRGITYCRRARITGRVLGRLTCEPLRGAPATVLLHSVARSRLEVCSRCKISVSAATAENCLKALTK